MLNQLNKKIIFLFLVLIITIMEFLSQAGKEKVLDSRFVEYFSLSNKDIDKIDDEIQDINKEISQDAYTIQLIQSLGNEQILYLAMDVTFPDNIKLKDLVKEEGLLNILPENILLVEDIIEEDDIKDLSYIKLKDSLLGKKYYQLSRSYIPYIDIDQNTIYYIFCFSAGVSSIKSDMLSVIINGFDYSIGDDVISTTSQNYVISWKFSNKGTIIKAQIIDDYGDITGNITLSKFSLNVHFYHSDYDSTGDAISSIIIKTNNGDIIEIKGPLSSSFSNNTGELTIKKFFQQIVPIEEIQSIEISDYIIKYI